MLSVRMNVLECSKLVAQRNILLQLPDLPLDLVIARNLNCTYHLLLLTCGQYRSFGIKYLPYWIVLLMSNSLRKLRRLFCI